MTKSSIGDPITNADQAIEACAKLVYELGGTYGSITLAEKIMCLKDRVASPSDRMLENANRVAGRMGAEFVPNEAPPNPATGVTARELLAQYYEHPLIAHQSMADEVRSDDWHLGVGKCERAMLDTFEAALRPQPDLRAMLEKLRTFVQDVYVGLHVRGPDATEQEDREAFGILCETARAIADEIDRAWSDGAAG